jgi:hypothetical protein
MKRLPALLALPVLTAASLALADGPALSPAERLQRLRRDLALVRQLVDGGLNLAREADPLRRAEQCNRLAEGLTAELQRALQARERARADALGQGLEKLLTNGVAGNLRRLPPDSPSLPEVRRLGDQALSVTEPLQQALDRAQHPEQDQVQGVARAVERGRAEVESARDRAGTGRPRLKAPPVGKRLKGNSK